MDTGSYYPQRDGQIPELDSKSMSESEYLLIFLAKAQLVKAFNNIYFKHTRGCITERPARGAARG